MSMTKEEALKKIEELKKFVEEESEFPKVGDKQYSVSVFGDIFSRIWGGYDNDSNDEDLIKIGNVFKTKEDAEMEVLRLKSKAQAWVPKDGEDFYYWDFGTGGVVRDGCYILKKSKIVAALIGNYKKTEAECQAWYDEFGKAFEYLIK